MRKVVQTMATTAHDTLSLHTQMLRAGANRIYIVEYGHHRTQHANSNYIISANAFVCPACTTDARRVAVRAPDTGHHNGLTAPRPARALAARPAAAALTSLVKRTGIAHGHRRKYRKPNTEHEDLEHAQ
ncbi:hypothetical protein EVAR_74650_1 [Eumeta japonica]|uniref:Uncharacterized protein n=1 Tax=Eumeta variegata TaxID=151549 RepID=A0A4C1WDE7_EUMVA|nr:hypothetical protein EVAR_74650_1 [Eumeta japonica]